MPGKGPGRRRIIDLLAQTAGRPDRIENARTRKRNRRIFVFRSMSRQPHRPTALSALYDKGFFIFEEALVITDYIGLYATTAYSDSKTKA